MKSRRMDCLQMLGVCGLVVLSQALSGNPAAAQPKPTFTYQPLGTLGGATSTAEGVNSHGEVVGMTDKTSGARVPYVWSPIDGMQDLNSIVDGPLQENGPIVFGPDCTGDGSPDMYVLNWAYTTILDPSIVVFDGQTMDFVKVLITDHGEGLGKTALRFTIEDGRLYVPGEDTPDGLNEHIFCYDVMTGEFLGFFATPVGGGTHYGQPVFGGPDVDEDDIPDVLVPSNRTKQVLAFSGDVQFDGNGNILPAEFLGFFVDTDAGLGGAGDMLLGPDRDGDGTADVYVGDNGGSKVQVFSGADGDTGGTFIEVFVDGGAVGMRNVNDMEWGPDGNLYISDNGGLTYMDVYRFDGDTGALIGGQFVPSEVSGTTGGVPLFGFDLSGDLLISDQMRYQILRFEGPNSQNPGAPLGVAVEGTTFTLKSARDINNAGQIAGWGYRYGRKNDTGKISAYRYTPPGPGEEIGEVIDLELPGSPGEGKEATAINNHGDVAGHMRIQQGSVTAYHAFLWREGVGVIDLGMLGAGRDTYVTSISNRNAGGHVRISGWASATGSIGKRAWRYDTATGVMQDLGIISGGVKKDSQGWDLNDAGVVTGTAAAGNNPRAFTRALTGAIVDLGTLGGNESYGTAIDPFGNVVGTADTHNKANQNQHQAFLRTSAHGMFKLEPQITNLPAAMQLKIRPSRINQYGQIVGPGPNDPAGKAFILTPQ